MNGLKFTVKLFAIIAALCLGLNLSASELEGRWSIVSANIDGQEVQTAGQKCFEDSFFEVSGRKAKLGLSSVGEDGACKSGEASYAFKSIGAGKYALGPIGEFWLDKDALKVKQSLDGGKFIVFSFKKDAAANKAAATATVSNLSTDELEGRWEIDSVAAQGQTFKTAGQKCFEDSFFQIAGGKAIVSIVAANPDGTCKTGAGESGYKSLGSGRYALDNDAGEFRLKNGSLEYEQRAGGILFTFKKSRAAQASSNQAQAKSSSNLEPEKDPSVKHSDAGASKKGTGVFAGKWLFINTNTDISFYLRDDGTYASRLEKPDWRTRIDGTYKVKDGILTITSNDGYDTSYYCENDDCTFLWNSIGTGYYMFQAQIPSQMPKECFSFRKDSSSSLYGWSGGSDTVSVGVSGYYCFDGKGRFSSGGSSYAMATSGTPGGSIDGGSSKSRSDEGSYTLDQGELTLKYDDGTVVRHSFFYTPPRSKDNKAMAIIDGEVYR
ncbi:hypothetical protein [uncultured Campylobacter sp.]|uniref:hypothetical protein n=1 Tax=uncultured Campylobacter sp. TaxID=218934 RepID=UPI00262BC2C9|nr:hypothetical protein [uncultured Campylobacter sp.]